MKRIYRKYSGGGEGREDSNFEADLFDDGSLVITVAQGDEADYKPFLAEKHIFKFIDALRRAYADRYDIVGKTARRSATKGISDDQRYSDGHTKP